MPETILVVDDEEKIRCTLRGVLSDEGFDVVEAADGRRALELLQHVEPRLAIVDVWMPEVDGIELVERMRSRAPRLPIIVISGHGTIETAMRVIRLGACDFLEKPFQLDALLQPLPPGSGILFGSISSGETVPAVIDHVDSTDYATTLARGGMVAKTVEHLMATLHAYGITNMLVKMQGEVPILDGSALELCALLEEGGVVEQPATVEELVIDRTYALGAESDTEKGITIEPADAFEVHYTLDYPPPIGRQAYEFRFTGVDAFRREIAPARTFGFVKEIETLEQMGLASGGRLNNCILVGPDGVVNAPLRFSDEFVRHKILDIFGDFYLLGRPVRGRVTARMTGHSDNAALLRQIRARIGA